MASFGLFNIAQGLQTLQHLHTGRLLDGSALALYLYDYLLTVEMERLYIWRANWNATKVLFLANRYLPLVDLIITYYRDNGMHMAIHCNKLLRANAWTYMVGMYISEIILVLRVWAVWKMNKLIVAASALFHAISFGVLSAKVDMMVAPLQYFDFPPLTGCLTFLPKSELWTGFVIMLMNDLAMMALMIIPFVNAYKSLEGIERGSGGKLINTVYREGVLFYIYMFIVSVITTVITVLYQDDPFMFVYVSRILRVSLAGRVVLHIRQAYATQGYEGTNTSVNVSDQISGGPMFDRGNQASDD